MCESSGEERMGERGEGRRKERGGRSEGRLLET